MEFNKIVALEGLISKETYAEELKKLEPAYFQTVKNIAFSDILTQRTTEAIVEAESRLVQLKEDLEKAPDSTAVQGLVHQKEEQIQTYNNHLYELSIGAQTDAFNKDYYENLILDIKSHIDGIK